MREFLAVGAFISSLLAVVSCARTKRKVDELIHQTVAQSERQGSRPGRLTAICWSSPGLTGRKPCGKPSGRNRNRRER